MVNDDRHDRAATDQRSSPCCGDRATRDPNEPVRRRFIAAAGALSVAALPGGRLNARPAMPTRTIPRTDESLPIVGLGSTRPVQDIAGLGADRVRGILDALLAGGGRVVDTWPTNADNDGAFGRILSAPELRDRLFVTINLTQDNAQEARDHFDRTIGLYGRRTIDLVNAGNLANIDENWRTLRALKDGGRARYIGATVAQAELHDDLETFVRTERPDFVMVNYSVSERQAEASLLPLCADLGVAVLVSRPFMNGSYFDRLEAVALPAWMREIECESWAQFSLQYILANPAVTCVLTETTNPSHMADNATTASKPYPGERLRARMRDYIESVQ